MQFSKSFFTLITVAGMARAFSGDATWYEVAAGTGACGWTNSDSDLVVALSVGDYGDGSNCGNYIEVYYNGNSVQAEVVDECTGCDGDSIDLSPAAFSTLADQSVGRISVDWNYV